MFKPELIEFIRQDYRELKDLEVTIDGQVLKETLYNLLTPYLAHKNTVDNNNRIITFYTQEGSKQQKLLPFYIGLSNYYKAFTEIKSEYSETSLDAKELESILSSITNELPSEFTYLNKKWFTKELTVDIEKNNRIHLFIESIERRPRSIAPRIQDILPHLKQHIKGFNQLEEKVARAQAELNEFLEENDEFIKFKQIRESSESKIGIKEILKLGNKINLSPSSGVLLFTNKTKYRKLIENTFINDRPITDTFSIAEIKFRSTGEMEVINIGSNRPIIYYCSSDFYAGWKEIKQELGIDYINTIVIDDFGSIFQKEIRKDFEYFRDFSKSIIKAQNANEIKDVYFLDEDSNFHNANVLKQFKLYSYPWLLNYQERASLIGLDINESCHKTVSIQDDFGSIFWQNFKKIVLQLNLISKKESNLDKKVGILSLLKNGYDLLSRVTSFHNPDIEFDLKKFIRELNELNEELESTSFKDKIDELTQLIIESLYPNAKISAIIDLIQGGLKGESVIVSKNNSSSDREVARKLIFDSTGQEVGFVSLEELRPSHLSNYQNAFFLHFSGKHTRTLFLSKFCNNQFLILNNRSESGYYTKCFNSYGPEIIELSDFDNKLILLNLEEQEGLVQRNKIKYNLEDYIEYKQSEDDNLNPESETDIEFISEQKEIEEQDFSFVIENILESEESMSGTYSKETREYTNYLVLFDNSFIRVPEWKHFHVMEEDESTEPKGHKKKVSELEVGDKVFIMEGFNNDFNELLTFLKNEYAQLRNHFDAANSWRLDLHKQYEKEGGFYTKLNTYLRSNGILVSTPTVEKWISGVTITPDSLSEIVQLFQGKEDSHSSNYTSEKIIDSTQWLAKFRTMLHKEIFQYHVFKKYGMYQQIQDLKLKSLVEKMDDIVSIKEVIMIQKQ